MRFIFSRLFICALIIAAFTAAIIFLCCFLHSLLPLTVSLAAAYLLSLATAVRLFSSGGPPEFECAILILIIALPVAGAILYFLSVLSRHGDAERTPAPAPSSCTAYTYFDDGGTLIRSLISHLASAKVRIYLEFYIVSDGHIWGAIKTELERAVKRGVKLLIIYDGLGSAVRAPKGDLKKLARAGAQIKVFNRLLPVPVARLNFRDHRKIAVIDDAVYLGGVNIGDEYANLTSPHGHWKDGGALFYGQIAEDFGEIFLHLFYKKQLKNINSCGDMAGAMRLLPVTDGPDTGGAGCEDMLAAAIYSAKERVYVFTPYLCAGEKLLSALSYAAANGAAVKIIIPAVPDKRLSYAITKCYAEGLVKAGAEVYLYTPGFMHFKGAVCDGRALLGSYNFDFRSMRLNHECGVWGGEPLCGDMAADFERCLPLCTPFLPKRSGAVMRAVKSAARLIAPLV